MKKKKLFTAGELFWYIVAGVFALGGLTLGVISIIGDYLPSNVTWVIDAENAVRNFFQLDWSWRIWGTILLALAVAIALIDLLVHARRVDLEEEKRTRRAQRLAGESIVETIQE